jgi:DNA-binding beta-propeller fold protein YncE
VIESIPVSPLPHHIEPSADGRTIYVSLASHTATVGAPQYAAIDTDDNSLTYVTTSENPLARSHGPPPVVDGETLYVAHDIGDEVSGVDTETGNIDPSITPILRAEEVIPTRFGHLLWASSRGDGTVKRIDLHSKAITASIPVGVQPESVMLTPPNARWSSVFGHSGQRRLRRYGEPHASRHGSDRRDGNVRRSGRDHRPRPPCVRHVRRRRQRNRRRRGD